MVAAVAMVAVAMVAFAVGVVAVVVAVAVVCFAALGEYATRRLGPGRTPFLFAGAWRWLEARTAGPFLRWLGASSLPKHAARINSADRVKLMRAATSSGGGVCVDGALEMDDDDMASLRSWAGPQVARAIGGPYLITSSPDVNRQILLIYDAAAADGVACIVCDEPGWKPSRGQSLHVTTDRGDGNLGASFLPWPTLQLHRDSENNAQWVLWLVDAAVPTNLTESAAMEMLRQRRPAPKTAPPPPAPPAQPASPPPPPPGYEVCPLEESYVKSEPFVVSSVSRERDRTKYVPHELDADLLRQGAYLRTDSAFEIDGPSMAGASSGANSKLRSRRTDEASLKSLLGKAKKSQRRERVAPRRNTLPMPTEGWGSSTDANCGASSRPSAGAILLRVAFFNGAHKAKEFEVHSEQTLLELRRELTCVTAMEMEYQRKMARSLELPSDSAAFCIEDEWFVSGEVDPSVEARKWVVDEKAAAAGGGNGESNGAAGSSSSDNNGKDWSCRPLQMSAVTFGELTIRLGCPYLFVHHGSCEHSLVFTRVSFLSERDAEIGRFEGEAAPAAYKASNKRRDAYPRVVWELPSKDATCTVCRKETAIHEIHGDHLADTTPCMMCELCYSRAYYTAEGELRRKDIKCYPVLREPEVERPAMEVPQSVAATTAAAAPAASSSAQATEEVEEMPALTGGQA